MSDQELRNIATVEEKPAARRIVVDFDTFHVLIRDHADAAKLIANWRGDRN